MALEWYVWITDGVIIYWLEVHKYCFIQHITGIDTVVLDSLDHWNSYRLLFSTQMMNSHNPCQGRLWEPNNENT